MKDSSTSAHIELGKSVIKQEAEALLAMQERLGDAFSEAVETILQCPGRLVVSGIGKSAIIGQKIVATMNSTGTPALFMHAAEAIHGDLGMVQPGDVAMVLSKSGNTPEIKQLLPLIRAAEVPILALVSNLDSYLARQANIVLDAHVDNEACPNNLAPTTSTTAALAMGDALAVALLHARGFTDRDFARYHPGGALGKRLYIKVLDLLPDEPPTVDENASLKEVIAAMTKGRLGATLVTAGTQVAGIITDGDLRRMLEKTDQLNGLTAKGIMTPQPKSIDATKLAYEALQLMEAHKITQLVVQLPGGGCSLIHLHAILDAGISTR